MWLAFTIVSIVLGGVGHLLLIGLCFAGMPNSSPQQMTQIKLWMLSIAVVALLSTGAGILLYRFDHPAWGIALNLVSPVAMFIILLKISTP